MLDFDKVLAFFSLFSGLESSVLAQWHDYCHATVQGIQSRLRPTVDLDAEMDRLCLAAAALIYCDYCTFHTSSEMHDEVRVGDITLRNTSPHAGSQEIAAIRARFLADIAPLLLAGSPAFIAVGENDGDCL